jgi:hypothetical protein
MKKRRFVRFLRKLLRDNFSSSVAVVLDFPASFFEEPSQCPPCGGAIIGDQNASHGQVCRSHRMPPTPFGTRLS